ncbi:MAG: DUF2235 domain-containing protein [Congregibacter sp.]
MTKRIVICADGTWNRPEKDLKKDAPTSVLRLARGIRPIAHDGKEQQVFYDWGVGSYYDPVAGGVSGAGLHKNIMDNYRYIVQNYSPGDELFLFGFSRGAYTIRSLCGMINNCGILRREHANRIEEGFELYKRGGPTNKPSGKNSVAFRNNYAHPSKQVAFVGVWDTVGAMGIPISFLGLFDDKDEFYDTKIGSNVNVARHALAIDEQRIDFLPTIWEEKSTADLKQVWFAGAHGDIGGGYPVDKQGGLASLEPLKWMALEAGNCGLSLEPQVLPAVNTSVIPAINKSRRSFYRLRDKHLRPIDHGHGPVLVHSSVKKRWDSDMDYRPENLQAYILENSWDDFLV